ncbi:M43 family zinc metalloprotease [Limnovirga soli]|uniref:Peptidase M43 pregnancy-associated plasma-A domain-containing protein n=1 Tax=Limnovirga soli TaxID=2656915 RepID=A0A8J8JSS9_9BACT|nr:M43 family zinc metalloprotease [Limnovirga soli]NNV55068.1 hypothetical protein [Limnovirga soli]
MKKQYRILIFFTCVTFCTHNTNAQTMHCGTTYFETELKNTDPNYLGRVLQLQSGIQDTINAHHLNSLLSRASLIWGVKRIPVVVHVIGNARNNAALSTAFSVQQLIIDKLNEDFRKMTSTPGYGNGVDAEIEFCLAQKDPNGLPTTGVLSVNDNSHGPYSKADDILIKNWSHWPPDKYLNIWICDLTGSNVQAWGSDPSMYFTSNVPATKNRDGVVCDMNAFGTRILTHEIGHWLNLKHTYSDAQKDCIYTDFCGDTPFCFGGSGSDLTNNCLPPNQCTTENNNGISTRQVANYMDDAEDCMNMFTTDQTTRMQLTLSNIRNGILQNSAAACLAPPIPTTCLNHIQDPGEEDIDCGGICPPCFVGGCRTVAFKINGRTTSWGNITNVNLNCPIKIIPDQCVWAFTQIYKEHLSASDPNAWFCTCTNFCMTSKAKYECSYKVLYISIQECDENFQMIGTESGQWFDVTNSFLYTQTIDLFDYLNILGNPLAHGKYFKIKIAFTTNIMHEWQEHTGFIKVFEPNVFLTNKTITNSQVADNITINNCSANSPINVVASNAIEILPNTSLTDGSYFINTIDCNNISNY